MTVCAALDLPVLCCTQCPAQLAMSTDSGKARARKRTDAAEAPQLPKRGRQVCGAWHRLKPSICDRGCVIPTPFPFPIQGEQVSATRSGGSSILRRMQVRPVAPVAANPSTSASLRDKRAKPAAKKHLSASVLQL